MKKVKISPVTSLFMSLSLALGILVGDVGLTTSHAQQGGCGSTTTIVGSTVVINDGVANGGIAVRDVLVNGELVEVGMIADSVRIVNGDVVHANGVIVGGIEEDPAELSGVIVGGDGGSGVRCVTGVIVGGYQETPPERSGVIVGGIEEGEDVKLDGASVNSSGTAIGGTLTGDNITIVNGIIHGQNLMLSGATINGGSISGTVKAVHVSPNN